MFLDLWGIQILIHRCYYIPWPIFHWFPKRNNDQLVIKLLKWGSLILPNFKPVILQIFIQIKLQTEQNSSLIPRYSTKTNLSKTLCKKDKCSNLSRRLFANLITISHWWSHLIFYTCELLVWPLNSYKQNNSWMSRWREKMQTLISARFCSEVIRL